MNSFGSVKFLGGTADGDSLLTGSCILVAIQCGRRKVRFLVDIGAIQCSKDFYTKNREILDELKLSQLDGIIITHPHNDHVGLLPLLVKNGFDGKVICTKETAEILPFMLADSAKIQARECARNRNKRLRVMGRLKHVRHKFSMKDLDKRECNSKLVKKKIIMKLPNEVPLYSLEDVERSCELVKGNGFVYEKWFKLFDCDLQIKLYHSGHVLGGAICVVKVRRDEGDVYLAFGGDLGRDDGVILEAPRMVREPIDYWFTESTYGDRFHPDVVSEINYFAKRMKEADRENKTVIIPTLALRGPDMVALVSSFRLAIPVHVHSNLVRGVIGIFASSWKAGQLAKKLNLDFNPFCEREHKNLSFVYGKANLWSKKGQKMARVIIATSGRCDHGPVAEYLSHYLCDPNALIFLVNYMAENTLGRRLANIATDINGVTKSDKPRMIYVHKKKIFVKAEIIQFKSFSGHADCLGLVEYSKQLILKNKRKHTVVFAIHGSRESASCFKEALLAALDNKHYSPDNIIIPKLKQEIALLA